MQTELLNRQRWRTRVELANAMLGCIEGFHDRRRRHSALGWASPHKTETAPQLLKSHSGKPGHDHFPGIAARTVLDDARRAGPCHPPRPETPLNPAA